MLLFACISELHNDSTGHRQNWQHRLHVYNYMRISYLPENKHKTFLGSRAMFHEHYQLIPTFVQHESEKENHVLEAHVYYLGNWLPKCRR